MTAKKREAYTVRLLDEDRGLASALDEQALAHARRYVTADVIQLERGHHDPREIFERDGLLGLLVLDGLLIRQIRIAGRQSGELVGPGAILRPWDDFGRQAPLPFEVGWRVFENLRIACLDRRFLAAIVRWPALVDLVMERAAERAQTLALTVAIHTLRHVDLRLLVLLWHLADRFGHATPEGIHIPIGLSHADLAELAGATRPSVSVALKRLSDDRTVWRSEHDRTWLLAHEPPEALRDLREYSAAAGWG